jgi:hypothetical protein
MHYLNAIFLFYVVKTALEPDFNLQIYFLVSGGSFSREDVLHHFFCDPTPHGGVNSTVLNLDTGTR